MREWPLEREQETQEGPSWALWSPGFPPGELTGRPGARQRSGSWDRDPREERAPRPTTLLRPEPFPAAPAAPSLQAGILYLLGPEVALGPPEKGPTHGPLGRGVGAGTGGGFHKVGADLKPDPWFASRLCGIGVGDCPSASLGKEVGCCWESLG